MNTQLKLALIVGFSGTVCMIDLWATDVSSADVALNRLVEGNRRFVSGTVTHPDQSVERRTELASGQSPFAIVLACADSRVSPELIFDQGLGDIFVLRNAGNLIDEHTIGSIE